MCGIAGWIGNPQGDQSSTADRMGNLLRHRGPDAGAVRSWPDATLIHRRLSIIDLSPLGLQPMCNEDETVWTVYNGEIYNHHELRRELEAKGHVFRGRSDTQVILHLYEEEGAEFARRLRGMFAIALYDTLRKKLILTRDRFGIKPLFYAQTQSSLAFASEINALRAFLGIDLRIDPQAVHDYTSLFFIPAPQTIHRGIRTLLPAETLEVRLTGEAIEIQSRQSHSWTIAPDYGLAESAAVEETERRVFSAVGRQIESDVPLGSLLSGGIDSSLVSAAAQSEIPAGVHTYNVRFPEKEYDETWAALEVARHIGSRHETLEMSSTAGTWDHIESLLKHTGQPYADTSLFAANAVFKLMRERVTVALSGDGGDEAFGGYDSFWRIQQIIGWQRIPSPARISAAATAGILGRAGVMPNRIVGRINELSTADDSGILESMLCWIRPEEHTRLVIPNGCLPVRRHFTRIWEHQIPRNDRLESLSALSTEVQIRLIMANDYLFKVDAASMRESLEVRVPMLDEDLFAFGLTLPHALKVKGRTGKWILRQIASKRLPQNVAAKPKHGFTIPVDKWVDADFKCRLRETLLGRESALPNFLRPEVYGPIVSDFCDGRQTQGISRAGHYQRVMMLLSLHLAAKV